MRWTIFAALFCSLLLSAKEEIPHGQRSMPGAPLSPEEAIAKMQLPPGFKVESIINEPALVNPTSFTFDERGRIWVTESVEYPRAAAGKGQDRVKIFEDTDGDGKFEKSTIFKDGLNIPCGVVMGNGGVYITNSPDILFLKDTNGDDVADTEEVILTGFGRADRHELPNNLIWGPDGWLYFMNGVFNGSKVTYDGVTRSFTCGILRYHPVWKKFEMFSEGTSNPWGLDYNLQGDWFLSCCVIDHMFHMTQSGYYHRQGGPYPPFTRKLNSITTEKHQAAAYAGLSIYYGSAFPKEYQGTFFMGNLHGSCINTDIIERNGSTYRQKNGPDFISANDSWFMPVAQKVGPDGCLYIMDWYDKYHCYQDANRDSPGLDRVRGRIYRVSYNGTPREKPFDLKKLGNEELLKLLAHPNSWQRREAQRLLNERFEPSLIPTLEKMALDSADTTEAKRHALWLLCSQKTLDDTFLLKLLNHTDPVLRNWGVRAIGQSGLASAAVYEKLQSLSADPSPDVRVQVPIAAARLTEADPLPVLFAMLKNPDNANDPEIPNIVYNNLKPLTKTRGAEILAFLSENETAKTAFAKTVAAWMQEVLNASGARSAEQIVEPLKVVFQKENIDRKVQPALNGVIGYFREAGVKYSDRAKFFDDALRASVKKAPALGEICVAPATIVALWWNDSEAKSRAPELIAKEGVDLDERKELIRSLAGTGDKAAVPALAEIAASAKQPLALRKEALDGLAVLNDASSAPLIIAALKEMPPELKSVAVNALVQSPAGANAIVNAIESKQLASSVMNSNHVRQVQALGDEALTQRLAKAWGVVRTERDPERVEVIKQMKEALKKQKGSATAGWKVFEAKCQTCHSIYGKGNDVGPELTGAGRETLDAILANVLDPNLVIGDGYFQRVVKTRDGRILTGLLHQETDKQVILKREGGVLETIAKDDIAKMTQQPISLMPEGLEKSMTEKEFADLVEFLLTKAPPK
jgi:putative membrane-bound dehydrogenase-like protein